MKLFSERYKNLASFQLWTYDEVKIVEHGFTESENQNTINILKSRKWGFAEVEEIAEKAPVKAVGDEEAGVEAEEVEEDVEGAEEDVEAGVEKKRTKKRPAKRRASFTPKKKKENSALGMSDVDAFLKRH